MAIKIVGLNKLLRDIDNISVDAILEIGEETEAAAQEIVEDAKSRAPVDLGDLRQNILAVKVASTQWKVMANAFGNAPYSAYIEFGTGGKVKVPKELKDVAIKFKGKGVKQIDLRPRPFLYPAFVSGRIEYIAKLKNIIKKFKL